MSAKDATTRGSAPDEPTTRTEPDEDGPARGLLEEHVPLSLIVDLTDPAGPDSKRILDDEGLPEQQWWLPATQTEQG